MDSGSGGSKEPCRPTVLDQRAHWSHLADTVGLRAAAMSGQRRLFLNDFGQSCYVSIRRIMTKIFNKKHLKNVVPIRHCEAPHAAVLHCHSPGVATVARRLRYRCPQQRRRQQRQRVTEGTAMAP